MGRPKFAPREPKPAPSAPPLTSPESSSEDLADQSNRWSASFLYSQRGSTGSSFAEGASPLDPDADPNQGGGEEDDDMSGKDNLFSALRTAMSRRKPLEKILAS